MMIPFLCWWTQNALAVILKAPTQTSNGAVEVKESLSAEPQTNEAREDEDADDIEEINEEAQLENQEADTNNQPQIKELPGKFVVLATPEVIKHFQTHV